MPYDFKDPKLQFSKLRGAIYQACADRHFATHFAQALFLHKTHLFEPEAICVYSALNGWRRAFTMPDVARFVLEHINDPCCRQTKDKGPLTILAQDIDWLGCSFDVNTASLINAELDVKVTLFETNKGKFQHFLGIAFDTKCAKVLKLNMLDGKVSQRLTLKSPLLWFGVWTVHSMAELRSCGYFQTRMPLHIGCIDKTLCLHPPVGIAVALMRTLSILLITAPGSSSFGRIGLLA